MLVVFFVIVYGIPSNNKKVAGYPRLAFGVSDWPHLYVCFESQCRIFGLFNYHESACSGPLKTNYINSGPCIHEEDGTLWDNGLEDLLAATCRHAGASASLMGVEWLPSCMKTRVWDQN